MIKEERWGEREREMKKDEEKEREINEERWGERERDK